MSVLFPIRSPAVAEPNKLLLPLISLSVLGRFKQITRGKMWFMQRSFICTNAQAHFFYDPESCTQSEESLLSVQ